MSAPRIGLIGARRVHQGLGPFVARLLAEEGAQVPAFLGTSAASVRLARAELERDANITPVGYTNLDDLLARERLDALAILSPAETHEGYLRAALARGLHVLCEKPLTYGEDVAATSQELAQAFAERGLLLAENCQWPHVLPTFEALHGPLGPLESFAMRMTPGSRGARMLADSLPHPLSVVQALGPGHSARLEDLTLSTRAPDAATLSLQARYVTEQASIPFRVDLVHGETLPREAALTINGRSARRRVRREDYALYLTDGEREVPLPDPLRSLLRCFLADLKATLGGAPPPSITPIVQRADMLDTALHAFRLGTTP